tara:strand:+ start:6644 stop:7660 length:1017 start_codon:yes stop_codon:yes gene_type:complete
MIKKELKNKSILITGGTGSFGKTVVARILKYHAKIKKLVVLSRDELKQFEMSKTFTNKKYPKIRFLIGDIRDKDRLNRAMKDIDIVIHAAALKQVDTAEYNPFEYIQTNVVGAQNLIESALDNNVSNLIALSTDKAVSPINLYGATKLCADKLFIAANNIKGKRKIKFSVVRYGNVFGSRGSVIPIFLSIKSGDAYPITDINMTRFNISLNEAVDQVFWSLKNNVGGEIFVPKIPSYRILDLVKSIKSNFKYRVIGIRSGEKIHEELISKADSQNTYDLKSCYSIIDKSNYIAKQKYKNKKYLKVKQGFEYNSSNNKKFLTVNELKKLISIYKKENNL